MSANIFLKEAEFYTRNINPLKQYVEQMGFYLHKMTNRDKAECSAFVMFSIKNKQLNEMIDPEVIFYERQDNEDRAKTSIKLSKYIQAININEEILAPTFTSYINSNKKVSLQSGFIEVNVKQRNIYKKEAFKADAAGNKVVYVLRNNDQTAMKLFNNSMSGAFASSGSVLKNPSAHSTLTSTTRSVSSLGNASNEKIIAGNRHYRNPDITLFNLISITNDIDKSKLQTVIDKYNLKYPSVEDVLSCIKYSTDLYWRNDRLYDKIENFIRTLDKVERAAIVYIGDLYHIRLHNDSFIRDFITRLSTKVTTVTYDDPLAVIKAIDEQIINYAHQVCLTEVRGIGKDYSKLSLANQNTLAASCVNIELTVIEYKDFIDALFLTKHVPASTAYLPNMVRRSVVLSDTDSTMFSVDEWVEWYYSKLVFNDEAFAIAGSVMFFATQCIAHCLAILSANMGVAKEKLFSLSMKPEFCFPVFAQSSVAKHYFTFITIKEGNIYAKPKMEIKGVHLKNSAAPRSIILPAHKKMEVILNKVANNEKISIIQELTEVANIERKIIASLLKGEVEYYKQGKIKNSDAYVKSAEESPYLHHLFWNEVFAPSYGIMEEPPYSVIKVPTILENKTALKSWVENIEDKQLASRLSAWLLRNEKTSLPTMYLSVLYVKGFGIPKEFTMVLNTKKVVLDLTIVNRMILETLGYFPKYKMLISKQGF